MAPTDRNRLAAGFVTLVLLCGCEDRRGNRFAAKPVSRSIPDVDTDALGRSSAFRLPDPIDSVRMKCEAELSRQSSYPFDFRLRSLKGRTLRKTQYAGRLLVVDIWATWCGPCVREVPHFIDLQRRYGDQGLSMVGINFERGINERNDRRQVESFAREQQINYPLALGNAAITDQIPEFRGYPTTLFIDGTGQVRLTLRGSRPLSELEMFVKLLLDDPSIDPNRVRNRPESLPEKPPEIQTNPFAVCQGRRSQAIYCFATDGGAR